MTIQEVVGLFQKYPKSAVKKSTLKSYEKFLERFFEREVVTVSADDAGKFLDEHTDSFNRYTRHLWYAQLKAFFKLCLT